MQEADAKAMWVYRRAAATPQFALIVQPEGPGGLGARVRRAACPMYPHRAAPLSCPGAKGAPAQARPNREHWT